MPPRYSVADLRERIRPSPGGSLVRIWPFILTVCFGIVFMAIADLAWLTAIGTAGPWYTSATSSQVYTATLTTATIATLILASFATSRLSHLEARTGGGVDRDSDGIVPEPEPTVELTNRVLVPEGPTQDPDGLDQILAEIGRFAAGPVVEVREKPAVRLTPAPLSPTSPGLTAEGSRDRRPSRTLVRRARRLVWQTVAGPLIMFLIFIAISGAMLPATGGFAQQHFQLNTGLILFLSYGWPFLVAWSLAAIAVLHLAVRLEFSEPPEQEVAAEIRRLG
jgi:hypothetical protein